MRTGRISNSAWALVFAAVAALYPLAGIFYGDLIPVSADLGYDGARSAAFAQDVMALAALGALAYWTHGQRVWALPNLGCRRVMKCKEGR